MGFNARTRIIIFTRLKEAFGNFENICEKAWLSLYYNGEKKYMTYWFKKPKLQTENVIGFYCRTDPQCMGYFVFHFLWKFFRAVLCKLLSYHSRS